MSAKEQVRSVSSKDRIVGIWDQVKASFGFLAGVGMLVGLIVGFTLPAIDDLLGVNLPVFEFETQDAASDLLQTLATVTVSVAGLSFSVTVVAFTLASNQLSPRVLRSFRSDRLSQATLAVFLGTFIYCIAVLVRLGVGDEGYVPELSITLAVLLALAAFGLFTAFIAHIVTMLQPSSIIATIGDDAEGMTNHRFPTGVGSDPDEPEEARAEARRHAKAGRPVPVPTDRHGYLNLVRGDALMSVLSESDAMARQRVEIGAYVVPGEIIAEVWADEPDEGFIDAVEACFELGRQRTLVQDIAFPVRQLSDVALKGLSPGVNDPTTAANAMEQMTSSLMRYMRADEPYPVRVDSDGEPRFLALSPDLNALVRLGFDQVRVFAASYPVVTIRLLALLDSLGSEARRRELPHDEIDRQARLLREGPEGEVPTDADVDAVDHAYRQQHAPDSPLTGMRRAGETPRAGRG